MRIDQGGLLIRLVHCKFSHGDKPGARIEDLYEVCGQAQKSIMWRRSDLRPFFRTLNDSARKKQDRDGVSPFEVGDVRKLYEIGDKAVMLRRRMEIVIAQPGLSAAKATTQQLDLLASRRRTLKPQSTHRSLSGAANKCATDCRSSCRSNSGSAG